MVGSGDGIGHNDLNSCIQSNLDYSKCQGPHESFRIIGSSNDRRQEFSDIFGKARTFHRTSLFCQSSHLQLVFSVK